MYSINFFNSNQIFGKVLRLILLLFIFTHLSIFNSCSDDCNPCSSNNNWPNNSINGSGNLISEIRDFNSFHSIHIATAGTVLLTQSDSQSVKLTIDDNLMPYLKIGVVNNTLIIETESGYNLNNMHLTVDVKITDLQELHTSSAGNFIGQNQFTNDEIRLFSSSAGNIFLNLEADYLYTNLSSAGNANLSGSVLTHDAIISSAGGLHAFNLETDTTTISLSSAGNAEVFVNELLNATLSSAGSLFYKGNPVINATVSSLGIIVNAN